MIANDTELLGTLQQISWAADALEGIRLGTTSDNVALFPALAESYLNHIREQAAEAQIYATNASNRQPEPKKDKLSAELGTRLRAAQEYTEQARIASGLTEEEIAEDIDAAVKTYRKEMAGDRDATVNETPRR